MASITNAFRLSRSLSFGFVIDAKVNVTGFGDQWVCADRADFGHSSSINLNLAFDIPVLGFSAVNPKHADTGIR